jgi:hypothetical protein
MPQASPLGVGKAIPAAMAGMAQFKSPGNTAEMLVSVSCPGRSGAYLARFSSM